MNNVYRGTSIAAESITRCGPRVSSLLSTRQRATGQSALQGVAERSMWVIRSGPERLLAGVGFAQRHVGDVSSSQFRC